MAKFEIIDNTITTMIGDYETARKNMKEIDKYFKRLKLKVQWSLSTKGASPGCWGCIRGVVNVEGDAAERAVIFKRSGNVAACL